MDFSFNIPHTTGSTPRRTKTSSSNFCSIDSIQKKPLTQLDLFLDSHDFNDNKSNTRPFTTSQLSSSIKNQGFSHTISSKIGPLILPEPIRTRPISRQRSKTPNSNRTKSRNISSDLNKPNNNQNFAKNPKRSVNFLDSQPIKPPEKDVNLDAILNISSLNEINKIPISMINKLLTIRPIFLQTLYSEGKIDPEIIGRLIPNLLPSDLSKFIANMTQETNFFVTASTCRSITDIEIILMDLLPIVNAIVWLKTDQSNFLYSPTLNINLPLDHCIVGYCAITAKDIITGDPSNHSKFDIEIDLPLLRDIKSLILLPIQSITGDVLGVLQVEGLINQITNEQIEFSDYYVESLQIFRNIVQDQLFGKDPSLLVPTEFVNVFKNIHYKTQSKITSRIIELLRDKIPCEAADIFLFDDKTMVMTRLTDNVTFFKDTGGISYTAGLISKPIILPHESTHPSFCKEIDGYYINRSILSQSIYFGNDHYVITLRAKWKSLSFLQSDLDFLQTVSPFICQALKLSRFTNQKEKAHIDANRHEQLLDIISQSMDAFATDGLDRWKSLNRFAQKCCDAESCFICTFDGRNMKYFPNEISWKFDDCASGNAYNFRELTIIGDGKDLIQNDLYNQLGIKAARVAAFPFHVSGKVAGAFELINPNLKKLDEEGLEVLGNFISLLFGDHFLKDILI